MKKYSSKIMKQKQFLTVLFLNIFCILNLEAIMAQKTPKEPVTESDYHLWGKLYFDKISEEGNWVSYRMHYDEHPDTLFVRNSTTTVTYKLPLSTTGNFNMETEFATLIPKKGLELISLKKGKRDLISNVNSFGFSSNGRFLLTKRKTGNVNWIDFREANGKLIDSLSGIDNYVFDPARNSVLCSISNEGNSSLMLITFGKTIDRKIILESTKGIFTHMVWRADRQSFAFLQKSKENNSIYYYKIREKKMYYLNPDSESKISKDECIPDTHQSKLSISDDGNKIFFGLVKKKPTTQYDSDKVQIWDGNDKMLYPYRKEYQNWEIISKLTLWEPDKKRVLKIATDERPYVVLNGNQQYAITFNPAELELQYKEYPNTNFYITNLESGSTKLWIQNQTTHMNSLSISPDGKYAAYFKEGNWWTYNFISDSHLNLTNNTIKDLYRDESLQFNPFGFEGWTAASEDIIIRDKYDLWKIGLDGKKIKKITSGRENNISYKIKRFGLGLNRKANFDGFTGLIIDPDNLLLEAQTNTENGYSILLKNQKLNKIVWKEGFVSSLNKAENNNVYVYQTEDFNRPPALILEDIEKGTKKILIQSNSQHYNYLWGKSEAVEYVNSKNVKLNSVLYYPAGYNPEKKYPMVVHIYEKWPNLLHRYSNPSLLLEDGTNIANLTAKGYFVLIPDINYEVGNPGNSAADCTIAATTMIIDKGLVYPDKIGLTGHSFGGYETNFIITQTNLFAAAVSGAGIGDFTGHYFSIGWSWGKAEIWRYEDQQNRMKKTFFEDKAGYDRNSPVQYADKVKTPVLLWTGEQDRQIHYTQSIAFYLALKRNNKKQIMLIYPDDPHVILNTSHQIDLTKRTEQWFDYYLKGETQFDWISNGTK